MSAVEQLPNPQRGIMADRLGISGGALSLTPTSSITNPPTGPQMVSTLQGWTKGSATKWIYISQCVHSTIPKSSNITNHVMLDSSVQRQTSRNVHSSGSGSGPTGKGCSCTGFVWYPAIILTHVCMYPYPHTVLYKAPRLYQALTDLDRK